MLLPALLDSIGRWAQLTYLNLCKNQLSCMYTVFIYDICQLPIVYLYDVLQIFHFFVQLV